MPGERDFGERVLRAVVPIVLDVTYLAVAGPALLRILRGDGADGWQGFVAHPRLIALVAALLFLVVPASVAGNWAAALLHPAGIGIRLGRCLPQ